MVLQKSLGVVDYPYPKRHGSTEMDGGKGILFYFYGGVLKADGRSLSLDKHPCNFSSPPLKPQ